MSDTQAAQDGSAPPSPQGRWSRTIVTVPEARVIPPATSALSQPCGVTDASGAFCAQSATWRGARALITAPEPVAGPLPKLPGRHLYAGQIWAHFGHFMAESLSRFWALDHLNEPPESIVFIPKRPQNKGLVKTYQSAFFDLLGVDIPVRVLTEPTEVEELIVPGQGFGLGEIAAGTDEFRSYLKNNFATGIAPEGPERLYLSRSALGGVQGGALYESAIEASLERDGYTALHPEAMPLSEQVARYRAATHVVGLDGSAFHLFGFIGTPKQRAGMILRRTSGVFGSIRTQLQSFCGIDPVVFQAIAADWVHEDKNRPDRNSFGELDFEYLAQMMHEHGFGPDPETWDIPRFREMKQAMRKMSRRKNIAYRRLKTPNRRVLTGSEAMN